VDEAPLHEADAGNNGGSVTDSGGMNERGEE